MASIDWHKISSWPEADLGELDVAVTNLLCAGGLPGIRSPDVEKAIRTLDQWAGRVQAETERTRYLFERCPGEYQNSEAYFRMMVLVTVLQRDLGVHYSSRFNEMPDREFFSRPEHLFIHGVLQTGDGTCSSLPPIFAAVGRRLGYPLKMVTTLRHVFLRWEGANGQRFNIECTSQGLVSHPDAHYLQWPKPQSSEQIRRYRAMQSLTPQELAVFIGNRGHVCVEHDALWEAVYAYLHACQLSPDDWALSDCLTDAMNRWDRQLQPLMVIGFPPMTVLPPPRAFPNVKMELEHGFYHMIAKHKLLHNQDFTQEWWGPLRRNPDKRPPELPAHITVRFPQKKGDSLDFVFDNTIPHWYDSKNVQPA